MNPTIPLPAVIDSPIANTKSKNVENRTANANPKLAIPALNDSLLKNGFPPFVFIILIIS
jgi:hypothetical protein